jgi:hypothetical protein
MNGGGMATTLEEKGDRWRKKRRYGLIGGPVIFYYLFE